MNRATFVSLSTLLFVVACGGEEAVDVPPATQAAASKEVLAQRSSELQSPVQINYRVIGAPIVGAPVALDLQFTSALGTTPYRVEYRVNDATAMQLPESQSDSVAITPSADNEVVAQQVTVIPLREGRLYLNVAAVVEVDDASMQTVTAIPIQVGPAAPRQVNENGTVVLDEDGNRIRSLPATED